MTFSRAIQLPKPMRLEGWLQGTGLWPSPETPCKSAAPRDEAFETLRNVREIAVTLIQLGRAKSGFFQSFAICSDQSAPAVN